MTQPELKEFLYKNSLHIDFLSLIKDDGHLYDACTKLASEMSDYKDHDAWKKINQLKEIIDRHEFQNKIWKAQSRKQLFKKR